MESILYLDMIFLFQGATHYSLLYASSKLSGYHYGNKFMLLVGSFVASLLHVLWLVVFFPKNGGLLLSFSTITVAICVSFTPKTISQYMRILLSVVVSSFLLGGGLNVLFMMGKTQQLLGDGLVIKPVTFPWYYLSWGISVSYVAIKKCSGWIENHITNRTSFCSVTIEKNHKIVHVFALIDTGNNLTYENQSVVIVEFSALLHLFSPEECEKILRNDMENLTPFSYSSLGNVQATLWGFKADSCTVSVGDRKTAYNDFWIGIQFDGFAGGFDAIVPVGVV